LDCCFEHVSQILCDARGPWAATSSAARRWALEVIVDRCAALDVHEDTVMACVRKPSGGRRRAQVVREFRTWTSSLRELRDWLADEGVTQATGVYWKPVWHVLVELDQVESRSVIGWWPAGGMLTPAAWPPSSSPRSHRSRKPSRPPSRSSRPNCRRPSGRLGRGSRASPDAVGSARPHVW
jgi:hypothetical protein